MRNLVLIIVALIGGMAVNAENYFVDGTRWDVLSSGTSIPGGLEAEHYYYISGDTVINDVVAHKMYCYEKFDGSVSETSLCAIVRTEGDKVYVKKSKVSNEWGLLYDFGLKPGEVCKVVESTFYEKEKDPNTFYVRCNNVSASEKYPGYEEMVMESYYSEDDDKTPLYGIWYKGIGSDEGPLHNGSFLLVGASYALMSVWSWNTQIFSRDISKLSTAIASKDYRIIGRSLIWDCDEVNNISIYTTDGSLIYSQTGESGNFQFPVAGVYIIRVNGESTRTCIR